MSTGLEGPDKASSSEREKAVINHKDDDVAESETSRPEKGCR